MRKTIKNILGLCKTLKTWAIVGMLLGFILCMDILDNGGKMNLKGWGIELHIEK